MYVAVEWIALLPYIQEPQVPILAQTNPSD